MVPRLNNYFMATVLSRMEDAPSKNGYNLIISQSMEKVENEITNAQTMLNKRVNGLLALLSYETTGIEHFEAFFATFTQLIVK